MQKDKSGPRLVAQFELVERTPAQSEIPNGVSASQVQGWLLERGGIDLSGYPKGEYTVMIRVKGGNEDVDIVGNYVTIGK